MIKIFNLRYDKPFHPWDIKVERSSPLGNPYSMSNESERDDVCNKYEHWFYVVPHDPKFYDYTEKLLKIYKKYKKLNLFCWCAPKRCHAEIIKEYLKNDKIQIRQNHAKRR